MLVLVAAILAGCAGNGGGSVTPTPTPTPDPTVEPTPTPDPSPSPTPTASPSPQPIEPPPPDVVFDETFDFSRDGDPTGQSPKTRTSEAVSAIYATVEANVTLERASPAPTTLPVSGSLNQPTVRVIAPDGTEILVVSEEGKSELATVPAQPGAWTVRFEGSGTMRAIVRITARP